MSEELWNAPTPDDWPVHGCGGDECQVCALERRKRAHAALGTRDPRTLARLSDPWTSKAAAQRVTYRAGSQKARLLAVYRENTHGLTDEEAGVLAGLEHTGYWKRCADLRNEGAIEPVLRMDGEFVTRLSSAGERVMVCRAVL